MAYSLKTDKIRLRAVERDDLDTLYLLENDMSEAGSAVTNQPVSRMMLWNYIENYSADIAEDRQLRLMIEDAEGNADGAVDISDYDPFNRRGFVGISILPSCRRRGYAADALALLCDYAANTLGMHQLAAIVDVDNEPSRSLFVSAGFKSCGRLRSWLRRGKTYSDAQIYQKLF